MNFGGDVNFGGASRLEIEITGITPGTGFDQLLVQGTANLGGTLRLTALGSLSGNATLPIVRAGELVGAFDSLPTVGASLGAGVRFNGITYDYNREEVLVSLTGGPVADFDRDGAVTGADLLVWQQSAGSETEPGVGADANCDGIVDGADLAEWNLGMAAAAAQTAAQAAVPEPSSFGLLVIALVGTGAFRTRRLRFGGAF